MASRIAVSRFASGKVTAVSIVVGGVAVVGCIVGVIDGVLPHAQMDNTKIVVRKITANNRLFIFIPPKL
jgi:hypothetical protein|tara:strand:- start:374 stop:580 length:207 start_codon:yes stop_codon:yes gene_type:complete